MKKIILDTNFLMIPFALKVDIFSEIDRLISDKYRLCIVDKTQDELKHITENQSGRHRQAAKFALEMIKRKKLSIIKTQNSSSTVDEEILALLKNEEYIVATQDKELKSKIRELGRHIMVLRQKRYLVLV